VDDAGVVDAGVDAAAPLAGGAPPAGAGDAGAAVDAGGAAGSGDDEQPAAKIPAAASTTAGANAETVR
jgi:hypothetical protein